MRRFLSFWWLCIRTAAGGNSTFANDWQWVFGNPAVSAFGAVIITALGGLAPSFFARLGITEMTTGMPALDGFLGALAAFAITWFAAFSFRFFNAPVTLFHQQKDRADKLDGTLVAKPKPSDKNLAVLRERYLSGRPPIVRELLDLEVDGLRAISDVTLIFAGLTKSTTKLTATMNRHLRKIASIKDSEKKRLAISNLASDLNLYSDEVDEYTAVYRALTPAMLEYTTQFVERSPQVPNQVYINLASSVGGNVQTATTMIQILTETRRSAGVVFRGVSADLNAASGRLQSAVDLLIAEASNYRGACEQLQAGVTNRMAS